MKKVLIHLCCGPCSIVPIQVLQDKGYKVSGYFANPNIHPLSEYLRRRESTEEVANKMGIDMFWQDDIYNVSNWLETVYKQGIADNKGGLRCLYCYDSRLKLTQKTAQSHGFDAFTTSLFYSKHQRHELILKAGEKIEQETPNVQFLYQDFRAGWQKGIDTSKEWGLYRQNYCACIFSETERFQKKLNKLSNVTHSSPSY